MSPADPVVAVTDHPERRRYEITVDGERVGLATYRPRPGALEILHTEIDPSRSGRGLGATLARHVLDDLRRRGLRVVPTCPFFAAYLADHPEDADLVAGD